MLEERINNFKSACNAFKDRFPADMIEEFFMYWTEPNRSGTKLRWELEKTWDIHRRLMRWARTNFKSHNLAPVRIEGFQTKKQKEEPKTDIDKLRAFYDQYRHRPADMKFENFGAWYDFMKENKLLKTFTKGEVMELRQVYGEDNFKCRCAVVQMTFNQIANKGEKI